MVDDSTLAFQPVIGGKDDRVMVVSDMVPEDMTQGQIIAHDGRTP